MFDKNYDHMSGTIPGAGTYKCVVCGVELEIKDGEELPGCPKCRQEIYRRIA